MLNPIKRYFLLRQIIFWGSLVCWLPTAQAALEFYSIAQNGTLFYEAPSVKAKKQYIVNQGYPVEVLVTLEGWSKVRDYTGSLAWTEKKSLSEKRTLLVIQPKINVHSKPDSNAAILFQAEKNVSLEWLEPPSAGWVRVKHRDGLVGFVRVNQVWGI